MLMAYAGASGETAEALARMLAPEGWDADRIHAAAAALAFLNAGASDPDAETGIVVPVGSASDGVDQVSPAGLTPRLAAALS